MAHNYYFSKYNVTIIGHSDTSSWVFVNDTIMDAGDYVYDIYPSYTFNSSINTYSTTGTIFSHKIGSFAEAIGYKSNTSGLLKYDIQGQHVYSYQKMLIKCSNIYTWNSYI